MINAFSVDFGICDSKMELSYVTRRKGFFMAKEVKVVTKKTLADDIAAQQGLTKKAAAEIVNYVFEESAKTLKKGGVVDINGFGKFSVKKRAARTGINPRTKEKIKIKAAKVPVFKASKTLKDLVK